MTKNIIPSTQRYYILVGDEKTWQIAVENSQWGFTQKNVGLWNTSNEGDIVLFYVVKPIQKIIGFGKIDKKFISDNIIWPDEKLFKRSLWKYRIKFKINYMISDWENGIEVPPNIMLNIGRKVISKKQYDDFLRLFKSKLGIDKVSIQY